MKYVSALSTDTNHINDTVQVNVTIAHDVSLGPWLSFPQAPYLINTAYNIKTQIQDIGNFNETNVPVAFYINGALTNTTNKNLNVGQIDSVSNTWTPTVAGSYTLKYVATLSGDPTPNNDTIQITINVLSSLPALCEGFNSTTFPPTNWSYLGNSSYWSRQTNSAYCLGTGSAMWDNYSAPRELTGVLVTLTFPAITATDSIHFALAYCSWTSYPTDSLILWTSSNGGTAWNRLIALNETQLNTASSSCSHPFTPACTDWGRRAYSIPIGTNKIQFQCYSGFGDHLYLDSIGVNACWVLLGLHLTIWIFRKFMNYHRTIQTHLTPKRRLTSRYQKQVM